MRIFSILMAAAAALFLLTDCKNEPKYQPSEAAQKRMAAGLDTLTGLPVRAENPFQDDACTLFSDAEFQAIFGINPSTEANKRPMKGKSYCLWTWKRPDWKERESQNDKNPNSFFDPEFHIALRLVNLGLESDAQGQFIAARKETSVVVPGIGTNALWQPETNTLIVQQKTYNIHLTTEVSDDSSQNLEKAKAIAQKILVKI